MAASLFADVQMAPRDPTLGPTEAFNRDLDPNRVNLGVGIYLTDEGRIPILRAVAEAEQRQTASAAPRGYLPIDGIAAYDTAVQKLLLGDASPLIANGRAITAQSLGGTGALKIGADLLRKVLPDASVAISDPTWENHRAVFESAGFPVVTYPYYDATTRTVRFKAMVDFLKTLAPRTIIVLHACCHNPTGADLTAEQWQALLQVLREHDLLPFLDIAYQGFARGIEEDGAVVRQFAQSGMPLLIASSFSKSFSLYGERVGALTIIDSSQEESARVLSQLKRVIRANYSTPPTHGGAVVATVLMTPELRASWIEELTEMRERIKHMRTSLVERLQAHGADRDFSFVLRQNGMFSYSGLSAEQVDRLREEFHIYAVSTGRICVAALNSRNVDYVAKAITTVLQ
ncbi:MAG: aspartate/tyrosine/aromatic aminotransferase [Pseudomonadota bacterium]|nr:aspartate/tyrosine/aromatic aminotransferase [Pseudomonadota bacterium]